VNTTPSSTPRFSWTTASDRPESGQDQPRVDATRRMRAAGERALVLHGGGSAGNAWEIGVIAGLFDAGLDVTEADLIIGTSAGSTAAAQITSATPAGLLAAILTAAPRQRTDPVRSDGGRVPIGPGGRPHGENEPDHCRRRGCGRYAPQNGRGGARNGCGVGRLRANAVARYGRRPAAQSALAGTNDAHHGGRCPYR